MTMSKATLLSLIIASLLGCVALPIPHEREITPIFSGSISDAETGHPIEGVNITLKTLWDNPNQKPIEKSVLSDKNGNYKIGLNEHDFWYEIWLIPLEGYCGGILTFSRKDYIPQNIEKKKFGGGAIDSICNSYKVELPVSLQKNI